MKRNGPILKSWSEREDAALRVGAARGRSALAISKRLGRSVPAIYGRAAKLGIELHGKGRPDQRPMPADFREHMHLGIGVLRDRYHAGTTTVRRWLAECGVNRKNGDLRRGKPNVRRKPMPADFVAVYRARGWTGTRQHYRCGVVALERWLAAAGIERVTEVKPAPVVVAAPRRPAPRPVAGNWLANFRPDPKTYARLFPSKVLPNEARS